MKPEEIRPLQLTELILLNEVDRICKELNIHYYLIGGTLLGAVRHGGFIPWDFDIDIAMIREDYEALKAYFAAKEDDTFFYQDYSTEKNHAVCHAIIRLKNTAVKLKNDEKERYHLQENGIYLDVFPLDYAPNDPRKQQKQQKRIRFWSAMLQAKKCRDYGAGAFRFFLKRVLSVFLLPVSFRSLQKIDSREMQRYNNGERQYLVSMASHYSYKKQLMPVAFYGQPQEMLFEGKAYYAPAMPHEYLTQLYRDYMKIPPENERYFEINSLESVDYGKYYSPEE